jgi:hypothetical protein
MLKGIGRSTDALSHGYAVLATAPPMIELEQSGVGGDYRVWGWRAWTLSL